MRSNTDVLANASPGDGRRGPGTGYVRVLRSRRVGERLVVLAVMLATFTGSHATEFSRNGPTGADDAMSAPLGTTDTGTKRMFGQRADDLHLVDPSRDELRQYLESIPLPTHAQNCEEWLPTDARAGFLLPVAGSARLLWANIFGLRQRWGRSECRMSKGTTRLRPFRDPARLSTAR